MKSSATHQNGVMMIEVMVTILIVSLGLLGIAGLFVKSMKTGDEAYQNFRALDIAHQLSEQLSSNRTEASKFAGSAYVTGTSGSNVAGEGSFTPVAPCSPNCSSIQLAGIDLSAFNDAVTGAQKTTSAGAKKISTLIDARGCVEFLGVVGDVEDPPRYRISVAWQGRQISSDSTNITLCGAGIYGVGLRRVVSLEVQVL